MNLVALTIAVSAVCLLLCLSLSVVIWRMSLRYRRAFVSSAASLRTEMQQKHEECLLQVRRLGEDLETYERNAQSNAELLGNGRLALPTRSRALQMLRSGMSADTAAAELGLARSDVRLLAKVGSLLATAK